MLHAFGDCLSTDYFFNSNHEWKPRGFDTWPHVLGKLLDVPVNNLAKTGAGNWRTARILHSLDLNENDIVIIPWSFTWAIELGVSLRFDPKINPNDIDSVIYDAVEDFGDGIRAKSFHEGITKLSRNREIINFNEQLYKNFKNNIWYEEMFKVMFYSSLLLLEKSKCKWIMFNVWLTPFRTSMSRKNNNYRFNHPKYIYEDKTMNNILNHETTAENVFGKTKRFWTKEEHIKVAEILKENLLSIYGNKK